MIQMVEMILSIAEGNSFVVDQILRCKFHMYHLPVMWHNQLINSCRTSQKSSCFSNQTNDNNFKIAFQLIKYNIKQKVNYQEYLPILKQTVIISFQAYGLKISSVAPIIIYIGELLLPSISIRLLTLWPTSVPRARNG